MGVSLKLPDFAVHVTFSLPPTPQIQTTPQDSERLDILFCVDCKEPLFSTGLCKHKISEGSICLNNDGIVRFDPKLLWRELMDMSLCRTWFLTS